MRQSIIYSFNLGSRWLREGHRLIPRSMVFGVMALALAWQTSSWDTPSLSLRYFHFGSTSMVSPTKYNFSDVRYSFSQKVNFYHIKTIGFDQFKDLTFHAVPYSMRENFSSILQTVLFWGQHYRMDPFWILAIAWTESHFRHTAKSQVGALGVMQVMPATGADLIRRTGKVMSPQEIKSILVRPTENIYLGVKYLHWMINHYGFTPEQATVAYNMGPNWVRKRLRRGLPVGVRNNYLNKVRDHYNKLTGRYFSIHQSIPLEKTPNLVELSKGELQLFQITQQTGALIHDSIRL